MPNRELFLKAHTTSQLVGRVVEEHLRTVGIPGYLLAVLTHVRDLAPVSPSEVSAASGISATTLRDNIQRLVDRKLVRRVRHPQDGRSYLLVPTPRGRAVAEEAGNALLAAYLSLEARLPRSLASFEKVLEELNVALQTVLEPVEPAETGASTAYCGPTPPAAVLDSQT